MPDIVLGARDTVVNKVDSSCIQWKHILEEGWEIINKKIFISDVMVIK